MMRNNQYLADIFKQQLGADRVEPAWRAATEQKTDFLDELAKSGHPKNDLLATLAAHCCMDSTTLTPTEPPRSSAQLIPADLAMRYRVVPLRKTDGLLTLAFGDPLDLETIDTLRHLFKEPIKVVAALPEQIEKALARLYPAPGSSRETTLNEDSSRIEKNPESIPDESDEPMIQLVNLLIVEGFRQRASDIHLEPLAREFRVRYRIDGVLREVEGPPRHLHPSVISRIKIMAGMRISEKRLPQDGRIAIRAMDRDLDLRISSIPTNHGESIVMRILDKENLAPGLPKLGFHPDDQQNFERLIHSPDGILLVTGPTGSGKTTTLYACLNHLNQPNRKIITVEDPVEYQLSGINQVQVRADIGLTFSAALRAMLRQAPNTIMIGEIRDRETAEIAINAALTGHLVLSTLHTNDAPSAVTRLTDIGVKPFLIASSVRGIMAQRLVRTLCPECKTPRPPTTVETQLLGHVRKLYQGAGCAACGQTGYLGRKGLFELLTINDELRQMIHSNAPATELRAAARARGMCTLREDGLRKATEGITTVDEVLRVTLGDEN